MSHAWSGEEGVGMHPVIVSATFTWKDEADADAVASAHQALADFALGVPGVRVCRYGLHETQRTSTVFGVYESTAVFKQVFDELVTRGSDILETERALTELVPDQTIIQGDKASLDSIHEVIEAWGMKRFHTDTQGDGHVDI